MSYIEGTIKLLMIVPHNKGAIITYKEAGKTYRVYGELEDEAGLALGDENFINIYYIFDKSTIEELSEKTN